jgi:hypothetical protein
MNIKNNGLKIAMLLLFIVVSFSSGLAAELSPAKAEKVDLLLKQIAKNNKKTVFLRKVTFSQDELNSYLNLVYIKRYTPEVKYIDLKLDKKNSVAGTIKVKLAGEKYDQVPSFFKDIEIAVSGKVECRNYRMRFLFENLEINGAGFSPEILDEAFGAAQADFKVKSSIYDWFDLLPGIKNIVIDYKKITIFY